MTRRHRAAVLLGLALLLGVLAASDMAGRERALRAQLAPVRQSFRVSHQARPHTRTKMSSLTSQPSTAAFQTADDDLSVVDRLSQVCQR